jgi:hypothetical protein
MVRCGRPTWSRDQGRHLSGHKGAWNVQYCVTDGPVNGSRRVAICI